VAIQESSIPYAVQRVLLVIRDARLRGALDATLRAHGIHVVQCASVGDLGSSASREAGEVALLDWSLTEGLLTEEHRPDLRTLGRLVPIALLVPGPWRRLLSAEDLGVAVLVPKPCGAEALLGLLDQATRRDPAASELTPRRLEPTAYPSGPTPVD
jgi:DNA-binding response OmpR family regulator